MAALNKSDDPNHWRNRAEEVRATAPQMIDHHTKAIMLTIAQDYEKLAVPGRATRWQQVLCRMRLAARGGDLNEAVTALRLVLQLERVPCLPQ